MAQRQTARISLHSLGSHTPALPLWAGGLVLSYAASQPHSFLLWLTPHPVHDAFIATVAASTSVKLTQLETPILPPSLPAVEHHHCSRSLLPPPHTHIPLPLLLASGYLMRHLRIVKRKIRFKISFKWGKSYPCKELEISQCSELGLCLVLLLYY